MNKKSWRQQLDRSSQHTNRRNASQGTAGQSFRSIQLLGALVREPLVRDIEMRWWHDQEMRCSYLLELFVCCELHSAVGHYSQTIYAVPSHEAGETFLSPHAHETL